MSTSPTFHEAGQPSHDGEPPDGIPPTPALAQAQAPAVPLPQRWPVRFTGSGSEYFRIWIVNLLLTLVTLGLYYPWAKVRRQRYFMGNTVVGEHPLGFHANPRTMLRGYLLVVVLLVLYSVAGRVSPEAGLVAFVLVAAVWPALLKSSTQFRLANTSWRGLRFRFEGSVRQAYAVWLPFFLPGLVVLAAEAAVADDLAKPPTWYLVTVLSTLLLFLLMAPWCMLRLTRFLRDNVRYGAERSRFSAGAGPFYALFAKTAGVALLGLAMVVAVLVAVSVVTSGWMALLPGRARLDPMKMAALLTVLVFTLLLLVQLVPGPFFASRLQNLVWSRTASAGVRFDSALRFWPLFGLTLKNWLLIVLTLGLYWPFAAVARHRLRVQAVTVLLTVDPQQLLDAARQHEGEAAGDAAGDLFGLDIGL